MYWSGGKHESMQLHVVLFVKLLPYHLIVSHLYLVWFLISFHSIGFPPIGLHKNFDFGKIVWQNCLHTNTYFSFFHFFENENVHKFGGCLTNKPNNSIGTTSSNEWRISIDTMLQCCIDWIIEKKKKSKRNEKPNKKPNDSSCSYQGQIVQLQQQLANER